MRSRVSLCISPYQTLWQQLGFEVARFNTNPAREENDDRPR
jgi:hypothetical protein